MACIFSDTGFKISLKGHTVKTCDVEIIAKGVTFPYLNLNRPCSNNTDFLNHGCNTGSKVSADWIVPEQHWQYQLTENRSVKKPPMVRKLN